MYNALKSIFLKIAPAGFIRKAEPYARKLLIPFYKGGRYYCNVCHTGLRKFVNIPHDLLCPVCGSRSRSRQLYEYLQKENLLKGIVLHFSPPRALMNRFSKEVQGTYLTTDYSNEFAADLQLDITEIDLTDNSVDLVICYHVLEHIEEDLKAMAELHRILKPDGICLIQTPFKNGETYENLNITRPEDRLKHFGQEDHVRIYSLQNLQERLKSQLCERKVVAIKVDSDVNKGIDENWMIRVG
ncbi:MAG: class I SAM-dependent methyltransferase [Nonlabens sp.]